MAEPLGLILLDGAYERVHYGLAMAASALAINRPAVLFFTNAALLALAKDDGWRKLAGDASLQEKKTCPSPGLIGIGTCGRRNSTDLSTRCRPCS